MKKSYSSFATLFKLGDDNIKSPKINPRKLNEEQLNIVTIKKVNSNVIKHLYGSIIQQSNEIVNKGRTYFSYPLFTAYHGGYNPIFLLTRPL